MNKKIIGFTVTTKLLFDESIEGINRQKLLCDIENEISNNLEQKFNCKVIGGKGGFIYADNNNKLIYFK